MCSDFNADRARRQRVERHAISGGVGATMVPGNLTGFEVFD
jgi:hypothetical protein